MKKKILITIISIIATAGLIKVNAAGMTGWAGNLPNLTRVQTYDCNTSNSCTGLGGSLQGLTINDVSIRDMYVSSNVTVAKGGTAIQVSTPNLNPGYLYNIDVYACFNKSVLNGNYRIYTHEYSNPGISKSIELGVTRNGLDNTPGDGSQTFNNCQLFSGLIVPNQNASWTALRITSDSSITALQSVVIATETKELGVYTETIRQIIENSNGNVKDAVDRVNNTLNQDHDYNTNPSESTENEKEQIDNYETQEDGLRNGLNLDIENSEITINPNANNFIWETINRLRGMSSKIVLLFTSVLSLGLIKIILGR